MSRKKTSPDSVNPLHRMFGTYLRVTRRQLGKSTEDASNELGLTESYYRLIEAGAIPIAPGLAFGIIRLLSGQGVGQAGQPRTIHFHRRLVLMTLIILFNKMHFLFPSSQRNFCNNITFTLQNKVLVYNDG